MHTVLCYIDLAQAYDETHDYSADGLVCHITVEAGYGQKRKWTFGVKTLALADLMTTLVSQFAGRERYRIVTNQGRLLVACSGLSTLIDDGILDYRTIEGEYVSREKTALTKERSILFALARYPTLIALDHPDTGAEITICDIGNYGVRWDEHCTPVPPREDDSSGMTQWRCKLVSDGYHEGLALLDCLYRTYCKVCRACNLGRPSVTYAAQGTGCYYSLPNPVPIRQTKSQVPLNMEVSAYFGGRHEPFGYGHYYGECSIWDISAFYPYIASRVKLPFQWIDYERDADLSLVRIWLSSYYMIADVTLRDADGYYPLRNKFRTIFPHGSFRTTLHHCELERALIRDQVATVHQVARYRCDTILAPMMQHLLSSRQAYERSAQRLAAHYVKLITNGWIGKLGSRMGLWEDDPNAIPPGRDTHWTRGRIGTSDIVHYRSVSWRVQRKRDDLLPYMGSIAVAGAVTAYGREIIHAIMDYTGRENVLYVATDSLTVNGTGARRLDIIASHGGFDPGRIRLIEAAGEAIVAGTGLYRIGDREGRQGFACNPGGDVLHGQDNSRLRQAGDVHGIEGGYDPATSPFRLSYSALMNRASDAPWTWFKPTIPHDDAEQTP